MYERVDNRVMGAYVYACIHCTFVIACVNFNRTFDEHDVFLWKISENYERIPVEFEVNEPDISISFIPMCFILPFFFNSEKRTTGIIQGDIIHMHG